MRGRPGRPRDGEEVGMGSRLSASRGRAPEVFVALTMAATWMALASTPACAQKDYPPRLAPPESRSCSFQTVEYDWDFATSSHGFSTRDCDASGIQVWEYGATSLIPGAPARVWGTILNNTYPDNSGAGLVSPSFTVTESSYLIEVQHYFETEWGYDGCNLTIYPYGTVVQPMGGYSLPVISESTSYYAWCVDGEPGWSGSSGGWRTDCFDLSEYMGMSVAVELDFGSDASVTTTGWYIARVRVGGDAPAEGACCLEDGSCRVRTSTVCEQAGGWFLGAGTSCTPNPCPLLPGACCLEGGVCQIMTMIPCGEAQGRFQGPGTTCDPNPCPIPTGACCLPGGACVVATQSMCMDTSGSYLGDGTACDPYPCGPLVAPDSLRVEAFGPSVLSLDWIDTNPSEDGYLLDRKESQTGLWQNVQVLPPNSTSWLDISVVTGRDYFYRVRAIRGGELSLFSNLVVAVPGQPPAIPLDLQAAPYTPTSVNLSWTDQATNELGFVLQFQRGEFGAWQDLPPARPANLQNAIHQGAQPASMYKYRIRSYNLFGSSAWEYSNVCTTPLDPGAIAALVYVKHRGQIIPGASLEVDHGTGFSQIAVTDSSGSAYITGLRLNDRLRATWVAHEWYTCRDYRQAQPYTDMGMQLWLNSDVMDVSGNYHAVMITTAAPEYTLNLVHSTYYFDLAMSVEWDMPANDPFWTQLQLASQEASDYLYDVSDGQMALRRIAVWDDGNLWGEVDVQIEPSHHPEAMCYQFMDCDSWSLNEHIYMGRTADGLEPPASAWYTAITHELMHYVFGVRDEYETAIGGQGQMDKQKHDYPLLYPKNFGLMDDNRSFPELSSPNDYPQNYDYGVAGFGRLFWESEQLWDRGKSCWPDIAGQLNAWCSLADIAVPQAGWFFNGASSSPDRPGPNDQVGILTYVTGDTDQISEPPQIQFDTFDSGTGSFEQEIQIQDSRGPLGGARVYRLSGDRLIHLGETDRRGQVTAVGLKPGDHVRVYGRTGAGTLGAQSSPIDVPTAGSLRVDLPPCGSVREAAAGRSGEDDEAPGAAVDLTPTGTLETPILIIDLWADEPLAELPRVVAFCAARIESLLVQQVGGSNHYQTQLSIPLPDPDFFGSGLFEIRLTDTQTNTSVFTTPFVLNVAAPNEHFEIAQGQANLNVLKETIQTEQLGAGAGSNTVPYRATGQDLLPIGDVYAFHLAVSDQYSLPATINVAYDDSLLGGIDERSLGVYRWDPASLQWQLLTTSLVSTGGNVASATVEHGGVFCLFATEGTFDVIPPNGVLDFGATGVPGQGAVDLFWSAAGDDGSYGGAQDYIVAYSEEPFAQGDWDELPQVAIPGNEAQAGTELTATLHLPKEGQLYYLGLRAKDEASNLSLLSNVTYAVSGIADPNAVAAPPTEVRAVDAPGDNGGVVQITWQRSYDDGGGKQTVIAYDIYRTQPDLTYPDSIATVPAGTTAYLDATIENARDYGYWVSAVEAHGETMSLENRAFAARNDGMPTGDFTSDAIVGVNDFALFTVAYGLGAEDLEFEPLFDLAPDNEISWNDFGLFRSNFATGGHPSSDPPGENEETIVASEVVSGGGTLWHLNVFVRDASNLAGYSFRVDYPHQTLTLIDGTPDSAEAVPNFLEQDGGLTPLFLLATSNPSPGALQVANVIQRASAVTAPEGDGFLAHLTFSGTGADQTAVSDIVLLDSRGMINYHGGAASVADARAVLHPHLYWSIPNPFRAQAIIRFQVPGRQQVSLAIYDVAGRLVRTLVDGPVDPGLHSIVWDGRSEARQRVPCGIYFDRFETTGYTKTRKITFVR
jgi:hypothetical protein